MRRAELVFHAALNGGGVWLTSVVLVEVVWVLRGSYKFDRATIAERLRKFLATKGVRVEDPDLAQAALDAYEAGPADFADYFILETARRGRCAAAPHVRRQAQPLRTSRELSRVEPARQTMFRKVFWGCPTALQNLPAGRKRPRPNPSGPPGS